MIKMEGQKGFSLLEVLVTLLLFGLLCTVAVSNLKVLENPLVSTSANLSHYFRLVRVRAIAQTRAIRVRPSSSHHLVAEAGTSCSATTFSNLSDLSLDIDDDVAVSPTNWVACFTQRGLVHDYVTFNVYSQEGTRTVEIALGGGVKIQ